MSILVLDSIKDKKIVTDPELKIEINNILLKNLYKYLLRFNRHFGDYSYCLMLCLFKDKYIVSPELTIYDLIVFRSRSDSNDYYDFVNDKLLQRSITERF